MKRGPRSGSWSGGDSAFSNDELMVWCEKEGIDYVLGLAQNDRLKRRIATRMETVRQLQRAMGEAVRQFQELRYQTHKSWSCERRVVAKVEHLPRGKNPRFIVTSVPVQECDGRRLYEEVYCARGDMENRIKEQQMGLFADRTSTRKLAGNQLRLYFSAFAYVMMETLRRVGTGGDEAGAGAELDPAGEIAEDRGTGPDHDAQGLAVVFRELPPCGVVADGSGASASPSASLLARTSPMEDALLGVRGTDSALESALGGETSLMSAGGRSNAPGHRRISAFVTAFESAGGLSNSYG